VILHALSDTMHSMLIKTLHVLALAATFSPGLAVAQMAPQPPMPMVVDLRKAELGSWASYDMKMGEMGMTAKMALVARDADSVSMETSMEGGMMAMMGGKMTMKIVMDPDPTTAAKPVKLMIMQVGDQDPMLAPDSTPAQKYSKPDPSALVGKETIKVPAGSFKTSHYRNKTAEGTSDVWVSEDVLPTGLVKLTTSGITVGGQQLPGMSMELKATGKGAKSFITKAPKPFDPQKMMGGAAPGPQGGKKKGKK
jgi:hypothetical protein